MVTGKNILNIKSIHKDDDSNLIIKDDGDFLLLKIKKSFIEQTSSFDLNRTLQLALSPLMLNKNFSNVSEYKPSEKRSDVNKGFKHIAFFIENMNHYTGGRYTVWHQAALLSNITKVTIITNQKPLFYKDFENYYTKQLTIIESGNFQSSLVTANDYDLIIGCPVIGGQYAHEYAKRFSLPLYMIIFESPNWIKLFRDGADADEEFWAGYKNCLFGADKILVPSFESKKYLLEWMRKDTRTFKLMDADVEVIYPSINETQAKNVKRNKPKEKFNIVFSSRSAPFKSATSMFKGFDKRLYCFQVIGKLYENEKKTIAKLIDEGYDIKVYDGVDDKTKFKLIANASCLIFPSNFEGFGMSPMEALFYGVPVVAYDLPVLREIYGDYIEYVERGNTDLFIKKVKLICTSTGGGADYDKWIKGKGKFTYVRNCYDKLIDVCCIPKITFGMIVYNGADYIKETIESIYDLAYEIIIVEGAVKNYSSNYRSNDTTLDIIKELKRKDHLNKIKLIQNDKFWLDKIEMQNEIAKNVNGEFYIKLDHDEVWKPETVIDVIKYLIQHPDIDIIRMPFYHFWLNHQTIAQDAGGKWSTKHPRVWRWKKTFRHIRSFNFFQDLKNDLLKVGTPYNLEAEYEGDRIYHFGYVRELKTLQNKIKYYKNRHIETYVEDTVTNYKEGMRTQPTQKTPSSAIQFTGTLPSVILNHPYNKLKDVRTK